MSWGGRKESWVQAIKELIGSAALRALHNRPCYFSHHSPKPRSWLQQREQKNHIFQSFTYGFINLLKLITGFVSPVFFCPCLKTVSITASPCFQWSISCVSGGQDWLFNQSSWPHSPCLERLMFHSSYICVNVTRCIALHSKSILFRVMWLWHNYSDYVT